MSEKKKKKYEELNLEDLPEETRRAHEEDIDPAVEALNDVLKKHGYVGKLMIQMEPLRSKKDSEGNDALGAMHLTRWLNADPINDFVDKFNEKMKGGGINSYNDFVDFLEEAKESGAFASSPIMMAVAALTQNDVDPIHVVMLAMNEDFQATLSDQQKQVLSSAMRKIKAMGGTAAERRNVPQYVEHIEDGKFVGFRDTETGEVEYIEGLGPANN